MIFKTSKYLPAFEAAKAEVDESGILTGDLLMVEKIDQPEIKSTGGIILSASVDHRQTNSIGANMPHFVRVLAVGKGFYNEETGEDVPVEVKPGDIILVGEQSVKWMAHWPLLNYTPFQIGLTREAEIQIKFKGEEGFNKLFDALNRTLKAEVVT